MRPRVFVALVLVLAGCGSSNDTNAHMTVSQLPRLVLQPRDVPALSRFDVGKITKFDAPEGPRSRADRFGRLGGWKADYKRSGGPSTRGPLIVHSQVDLFASSAGARADLGLYRDEFDAATDAIPTARKLGPTAVGGDAAGIVFDQGGTPPTRLFTLAWRRGAVSASISVVGFRLSAPDVIRLARIQDRKIAAESR